MGWPQNENAAPTSDYARFYPASCLETGTAIILILTTIILTILIRV